MRCPHCDDPKGIIWIDGVPEPCCDEIITAGARLARSADRLGLLQRPIRTLVDDDEDQQEADDRSALIGSVL